MNWFEILKGLYDRNKIDELVLTNSIAKGLITEEQKQIILGL